MPFREYPSLCWVNPNKFRSFIHSTTRVQPKVVTKLFLNTQKNKKWIKQLKFDQHILFLKTWDFSTSSISKNKEQENNFP